MRRDGKVFLGFPRHTSLLVCRPLARRLPRAPVGRAQLPTLERREYPQHFSGAPAHAQVVHAEPPNLSLRVNQVGCPKRDLLDRIQNPELSSELLAKVRQHREFEIAEGRIFLAPREVSLVAISTHTEHPRRKGAELPERAVELH